MRIKNILGGGGHLLGASSAIFALLVGTMVFPMLPEGVKAADATSNATVETTLTVNPSLAVTIPDEIKLAVQPTVEGAFAVGTAQLSVVTNNETGYSIYLSTTGENVLRNLNPEIEDKVGAMTQESVAEGFDNNTWGYSLSKEAISEATTYSAIPAAGSNDPQVSTELPANDTYNFAIGAKVDSSLASGTYTNTVTVSVVTNPAYVPTISKIQNMQEMTAEICNDSAVNETARLVDVRDGKKYWVAKLADGNCWMTQNLDFDVGGVTLSPETSNVSVEMTLDLKDVDLGEYVYRDPTNPTSCSDEAVTSLAECVEKGFVDVSGMTAAEGPWEGEANNVVDENSYDAHYLVGNSYGGRSSSAKGVCSKGWTLPLATANNDGDPSFAYLLEQYGLTESVSSGNNNIALAPLYFVRVGEQDSRWESSVGINIPLLTNAGLVGRYATDSGGYMGAGQYMFQFLNFDLATVNPAFEGMGVFWPMLSVRCVAVK